MRRDMDKVVVERERRGSSSPSAKTKLKIQHYDPDHDYDIPNRISSSPQRQYGYDFRESTDVLSPLRRYLQKHVGRPWDKVWSEIKATMDDRTVTGRHIFDHIKGEVELHCIIGPDGVAMQKAHGYRREGERVVGLYVHPETGILRFQPREKFAAPKAIPAMLKIKDGKFFENIKGIWYITQYRYRDPNEIVERRYNEILKRTIVKRVKDLLEKDQRIMISKKQAGRKELKQVRKMLGTT